ncbi:MAG: bifunctional 4-hydroxy-3-methylbut-2-enyl diphosphate reductase/30S ribosomal protein S1 [Bacillota bacterium]
MQVVVAKNAGFCFGVKRALQYAEDAAKRFGKVYSLGPLIHSPQEVKRLCEKGIISVDDLDQIKGNYVIIRSHGVKPEVFSLAEEKNINVIDATCPFVKRAQSYAKELAENGYSVVVVGDKNHPEVEGIVGWSYNTALVIENPEEAENIPLGDKIGVIAQTTQPDQNFQQVVEVLKKRKGHLLVYNTICHATAERQESVLALAKEVDLVLVIGGLNSANTKKLARISSETGTPTYHIEEAKDINLSWLNGKKKVGVTAGASTPDWIIKEVLQKMMEITDQEERTEVTANEETEKITEERPQNDLPVEETVEESAEEETQASSEPSFAEAYDKDIKRVRRGERILGTIVQVRDTEVLVDVGGKSEGVIPRSELSTYEAENIHDALKVGDQIEVLVLKRENDEGHPVLSKRRVDQEKNWEKLNNAMETDTYVTGKVIDVVKGGLLADVGVRGFIPASLVELGFVEDLKPYVGRELRLKVIECDRSSNKLVLSQKAVLQEEALKRKQETWDKISEGQTVKGIVRRLTNFGAFVDIGGVDGLLHVSEMAWYRVNHPSDVLKVDDELEVYILALDRDNEKISLGLKQLLPNPWDRVAEKYPVGAIVDAKVVRTAPFGAFLQLEPGVEGLAHISQLAHHRVGKTEDVVSPGDEVKVKVLGVDQDAKRISLSIKEALDLSETVNETSSAVNEGSKDTADDLASNTGDEGLGVTIGEIVGKDLAKE